MTKFCEPVLLDDVCGAFPDLKVIAYHFGSSRGKAQLNQKSLTTARVTPPFALTEGLSCGDRAGPSVAAW